MAEQVLYEELMRQLSAVAVVRRGLGRILPPDCPPGSAGVLTLLAHHGDMRMSKLADLLSVDMSVTSRHVAHVADRGWIERSPDPDDKRSRILRLTAAGRDKLDELSQRTAELLADRLGDWSDDEVTQLIRLMTRLRESFGDYRTTGRPEAGPDRASSRTPANLGS